jgi:hypothetical protein
MTNIPHFAREVTHCERLVPGNKSVRNKLYLVQFELLTVILPPVQIIV